MKNLDGGILMGYEKRNIREFEPFGGCCEGLQKSMTIPNNSFFFVSEEKILYLSVGYANTEDGTAWFDQAVIYCPFCGTKIQDEEEISRKFNAK